MAIWQRDVDCAAINLLGEPTLMGLLGIQITAITAQQLHAKMEVAMHHCQPAGIMHGGTSVVIAETLGSVGGMLTLPEDKMAVGIEINTSHLHAVPCGEVVTACAWPLRLGGRTQVWQIDIKHQDRVSATSRLTLAVVAAKKHSQT